MASPSSVEHCFHCQDSNSSQFRDGWRLRSGLFARLCNRCASLYEEGIFCEKFHSENDGWRNCESCGKMSCPLVHCGCIVSFYTYMLLDLGGVICMECSRTNFILERKQCLYTEEQIGKEKPQGNAARQIKVDPQYCSQATDLELQQTSRKTDSVTLPLFQKLLSASDAYQKHGRLVLPKMQSSIPTMTGLVLESSVHFRVQVAHYVAYMTLLDALFPKITSPHGCPVKILDNDGKEWEFQMYVLEGLKDYMVSVQLQAGDMVTFYRTEPEKKMLLELRKT
ncbi:hypothetical protein NMG60_11002310 [Bertholletia excelsa]